MQLSSKGAAFIAGHEGFVARAYRDPVGVLTIGFGFTMRSRVFADYWRRLHGRDLRMGDRLSRREAEDLLRRLVDEEYGPAVTRAFGPLPQHRFDAACSVAYNLGPRALGWAWARALQKGDVARAAAILARNYNTAGGRRLAGLVRRRREEAQLLETGVYATQGAPATRPEERRQDMELLASLGYRGPEFRALVRRFQRDHPPLRVDGLFGPASRAAALAALAARTRKRATGGGLGALAIGGVGAWLAGAPAWMWGAVGLAAGACVALLAVRWRRR